MSPNIGERIREARQVRSISMRQLAKRVGIHFSHLSKIESGKDTIGRDTLIRVAEELGVDTDMMLGEAGHQALPFRIVGTIAAGIPIEAIEDVETFDLAKEFDPESHFILRVKGDSMIEDGIRNGDLAILRTTTTAGNGDTVAAIVDGEATLKRYKKARNKVTLTPANNTMTAKEYGSAAVEIRGVLVGVIRTSIR